MPDREKLFTIVDIKEGNITIDQSGSSQPPPINDS
ncbi:hypothetical protein NECAME_00035 [Necator americanus]|uniref:Uncharacterized protein n=1 Tax=Necator americanus TaxID=51031 RepID=W2U1D0_NECAM|nr:hypothetical protein NECAME_00035 [Necator americanus]ETN87176.1 hypothetical protein NECAME_00035 [Necator americanus]